MNFKDFIPPVLIQMARNARGLDSSKHYESYAQALKDCSADAYLNSDLCNMIADKTVIFKEQIKNKPFVIKPTNIFLLASINEYLLASKKKSLRILDFGGACGAHFFELRRLIPKEISLQWIVVETEQMLKSALTKGFQSDELSFKSNLEDVIDSIDFIHSSSALQYVPEPYVFIDKLIKLKADRIFFNRMMFNNRDTDFVSVQKSFLSSNGPGDMPAGYRDRLISYPHTTMSFQKFNSNIIKNGYVCEWVFDESSGSFQRRNEQIMGKGLLYIRK